MCTLAAARNASRALIPFDFPFAALHATNGIELFLLARERERERGGESEFANNLARQCLITVYFHNKFARQSDLTVTLKSANSLIHIDPSAVSATGFRPVRLFSTTFSNVNFNVGET